MNRTSCLERYVTLTTIANNTPTGIVFIKVHFCSHIWAFFWTHSEIASIVGARHSDRIQRRRSDSVRPLKGEYGNSTE